MFELYIMFICYERFGTAESVYLVGLRGVLAVILPGDKCIPLSNKLDLTAMIADVC